MRHDEVAAKEIGLPAVLHDIGKIRFPDYVLVSPESLGDDEWALMKRHTIWGGEFLGDRRGFGPPQRSRGATTSAGTHGVSRGPCRRVNSRSAAVVSVADSLDAMTIDRPYRSGRPLEDAILEVQAWSGRQFSPRVVLALVSLYRRASLPGIDDDLRVKRHFDARAAA